MDHTAKLSLKSSRISILAVAFFVTLFALPGYSEQNALPDVAAPAAIEGGTAPVTIHGTYRPFSKIAVGVNVGLFGPGVEIATPISRRTNLRVDGSFFNYNLGITQDNVNYNAALNIREVRTSYDFFPFHGSFRISGGAIVYNNYNIGANASLMPGSDIKLNGTEYYSAGGANALQAKASLQYGNKVAPTFTFGWGNAVPRSRRHFAFPVEIGAAYTGTPQFNLNVSGSGCANGPCSATNPSAPVTSLPGFTSDMNAQIAKIKNDLKPARFYPILNTGVTYRF